MVLVAEGRKVTSFKESTTAWLLAQHEAEARYHATPSQMLGLSNRRGGTAAGKGVPPVHGPGARTQMLALKILTRFQTRLSFLEGRSSQSILKAEEWLLRFC
ncbi:hypothetical protein [Pontibacter litorisediminis]|uniref:hypothetical protein n=1 Tax=Pontibacter litorisediminis TaxID=1846260 RepID=UPI0023EC40BC|nr:hypothetical protein [Pontibacter litorisediminis]